jgi:prolyl 4-hydroxylase
VRANTGDPKLVHTIDDLQHQGDGVLQEEIKSVIHTQKEDLFSSTSKLEELVDNELQIVDLLDTFASYTLEKAQLIKSYVEGQKRLLMNGKTHKDIVAHPVEAYLLVRRLTADWDEVHMALHGISNYSTGVFTWIEAYREGTNFPRIEDLNGAAQAIVRLQDTYKLDIGSLAGGLLLLPDVITNEIIKEFHGSQGLSARDMLFIGRHAFKQGLYNRAIEWLQKSQEIAKDDINSKMLLEEIVPSLRSAIEVHDDVLERQGPSGVHWKTNPVPINPKLARSNKYKGSMRKNEFVPRLFQRQTEDEEIEHYIRLCRGEKLREPALDTNLKCRLKRSGNPYFKIAPLKVEVASHDPYIVIIHDFITYNQTDHLIELGKPKLLRSKHRHQGVGTSDIASQKRISQNAWIKDWEDPILRSITERVQVVTGLKASEPKEAEDYQIANYGLGGLYVPHTDHLMNNPDPNSYTPWELFIGDRVATLMIYLSDVDSGGATVFPRAGITLWPEKGAAAFWWNLDRSGTGDENTRHGACPVLHGDKWVSNKWIRHNEQFLTAKCGLRSLDKFHRP